MKPTVNDVRTMLSDVQSVTDEQAQTALDVAHAIVTLMCGVYPAHPVVTTAPVLVRSS